MIIFYSGSADNTAHLEKSIVSKQKKCIFASISLSMRENPLTPATFLKDYLRKTFYYGFERYFSHIGPTGTL